MQEVKVDGENIKVTPIEYKILELLLSNKGKVFSIDEYMKECGKKKASMLKILVVHVRRIREKIEINPREPKYLKVVWGVGYKLKNYSWKIVKNKSLIFNCILILSLYILMQVVGILLCYAFFSDSLLYFL